MTASPAPTSPAARAPKVGLTEWFGLRRYPLPDVVDTLEKLPPSLLSLVEPALPDRNARIEGAFVLPSEYYTRRLLNWEYVPERVVVFLRGGLIYAAAESPTAPAQVLTVDAQSLLYLRSSLLLLYGLLEFEADCSSQPGEVKLEYNTVIWQALRPLLTNFVNAATGASRAAPDPAASEAETQAHNAALLAELPFKFANGLRYYSLVPGERLQAAVFQPARWEGRGILPRQLISNTLFAFTGRKVVLIEEKRASVWYKKSNRGEYGWIFTYIPLDRVVQMAFNRPARSSGGTNGGQVELTLELEWGSAKDERRFILAPAVAESWERAWSAAHLPHA